MRSVSVSAKTDKRPESFWEKIINVKDWDHLIKFVNKIYINDLQVKEGAEFYDITSIFWIPTKIKHKIVKIEKYKKFYMQASLPFKQGIMYQNIDITNDKDFTIVNLKIDFKIYFFIFDLIFGPLLEKRLKIMLVETLNKLRDDLGGEIISG